MAAKGSGGNPCGLALPALVLIGSAAHVGAAAAAGGAMAWGMGGMALACLTCLIHLRTGGRGGSCAATHLLFMSAGMVLVHMAWLTLHGGHAGHHEALPGPLPAAATHSQTLHAQAMLAVVAVEVFCMAGAAGLLRRARTGARGASPTHPHPEENHHDHRRDLDPMDRKGQQAPPRWPLAHRRRAHVRAVR
ncbi:hypothetical protein GCM10023081_19110 [Arthrobacter ginkgonis]|uniref:DUF5134 domain-containing protein n=1 Tax=Arthrobacter ginkgonis TaxID=1630594 RepID=A0ABP7C7R7_9MICC